MMKTWEFGAPANHHCCSIDCGHDDEIATMTLLNPVDGGDPLYYCYDCYKKEEYK